MALKILIADPDEEWLYAAKGHFEKLFYKVEVVSNGKDAQLALYNDEFFAVVLSTEIKNHSGLQVLRFIKSNHANQMVIMLLEKVLSEEDAKENELGTVDGLKKFGASEVLVKPFEFQLLQDTLEGHQSVGEMLNSIPKRKSLGKEEEVDLSDDKFTSIRIADFYTSQPVLFDIYIKLKSGKYIKILHAGDSFSNERLDKYKNEKGVEELHFQKSDLSKFIKFNNYLAGKIINNEKAGAKVKVKLLQNVSSKYLEQVFTEGLKPTIIEQGKEICENMFNLIEKEPNLYQLLRSYQDFDPNAFTHAYLVSLFSTSMIKQFEWQSRTTVEATAMACLFHDIGMLKIDPALKDKDVEEMSETELEEYKKHPELGCEMLEGNRLINNSVKQIILQHHESYNGKGFPFGRRGSKILTLANIVAVADDFTKLIVAKDLKPVAALKEFLQDREGLEKYNSRIIENLIKVFVDPEKIKKENILPSNSRVVSKKAS